MPVSKRISISTSLRNGVGSKRSPNLAKLTCSSRPSRQTRRLPPRPLRTRNQREVLGMERGAGQALSVGVRYTHTPFAPHTPASASRTPAKPI
jgi:hypothetical protein